MLDSVRRWLRRTFQTPLQEMLAGRSAFLHGGPNRANVVVNERTALGLASFVSCVNVIAGTKASLPIRVYEYSNKGNLGAVSKFDARVMTHDVAGLLGDQPNANQTPFTFHEFRQTQLLCSGNSYTEIVLDRSTGRASQLIPLEWATVEPFFDREQLKYKVNDARGVRVLDQSQMIHVPAMGNGYVGWSPLRLHAETLGISLGTERHVSTFFGNGVKPLLVVDVPGTLTPERRKQIEEGLEAGYAGENSHRALVTEAGMKVTPIAIPANEAQLLETRRFNKQEIAGIFRVPPHMIGDVSDGTNWNIDAKSLAFVTFCLRTWLEKDEQELKRKLFPPSEWTRFYLRHDLRELLRGDIQTRVKAHHEAILSGWKTRNEVRDEEDLPRSNDPTADELLKPEAIFGKSGGQQGNDNADAKQQQSGRKRRAIGAGRTKPGLHDVADPQPSVLMRSLVRDLLNGLLSREANHVATKPDQSKLTRFYTQHAETVRKKLSPFGEHARPIAEELLSECFSIGTDPTEYLAARQARLEGWVDRLLERIESC